MVLLSSHLRKTALKILSRILPPENYIEIKEFGGLLEKVRGVNIQAEKEEKIEYLKLNLFNRVYLKTRKGGVFLPF